MKFPMTFPQFIRWLEDRSPGQRFFTNHPCHCPVAIATSCLIGSLYFRVDDYSEVLRLPLKFRKFVSRFDDSNHTSRTAKTALRIAREIQEGK